jgi:DNA repair protein RecN (Recombination protein N)
MLSHLTIRNLALIESLSLEFEAGLNILTGETGAGKSIVIGGLQLILGQRADKGLLRAGAASGEVTAVFDLEARAAVREQLAALLAEAGLPPADEPTLILRRVLNDKGARQYINDTPATLATLRAVGELLVEVHGPYDHQALLQPVRQLAVLDAFAGLEQPLAQLGERYRAWQAARERLAELERQGLQADQIEFLRQQVREITEADPQPDEDSELSARHALAAHARQVLELAQQCRQVLTEGESALTDGAAQAMRLLYELQRFDAPTGQRLVEMLDRALAEINAVSEDLADYGTRIELDPREFAQLEARLATLQRLKRKHGGSLEGVLAARARFEERLRQLQDFDTTRADLELAIKAAEGHFHEQARALSQARRVAAGKLAPLVSRKLRQLGFNQAELTIILANASAGPSGCDAAEFNFAPNPGEGAKPLRQIASSGEMARVMLALKTVLAAADATPLLIFDEVDANIGGVVAHAVGRELAALADGHQVLCITHLPQVAAGADRHFQVRKDTRGGRTLTLVEPLNEAERVAELARMLGGSESSSVVHTHAAELLAKARRVPAPKPRSKARS